MESAFARGRFRRARLRPIVCLACACQGCPKLTMALRAGGLFAAPPLTSTGQTRTWLLRIARRGFLAGDF